MNTTLRLSILAGLTAATLWGCGGKSTSNTDTGSGTDGQVVTDGGAGDAAADDSGGGDTGAGDSSVGDSAVSDARKSDARKSDGGKVDARRSDGKVSDMGGPAPVNAKCTTPTVVTLAASGATTVTGTSQYAPDEFAAIDCGKNPNGPWPGAQVYYKVKLDAGKTYRIDLQAQFDSALYAFPASTKCDEAAINLACANPSPADPLKVYNADKSGTGEAIFITPTTAEDWIIVVDYYNNKKTGGAFTMTITPGFTPAANGKCSGAQAVTLTSGSATIKGDTAGVGNEMKVNCGGTKDFNQGQLFYKLSIPAGKNYRVTVNGEFDTALYAFPASANCQEAAVNTGCKNPTPADATQVLNQNVPASLFSMGTGEMLRLKNATGAAVDWIIVVDSMVAGEFGPFTLQIDEWAVQTGASKCATPQTITLPATVKSDTTGVADEFPAVACGNPNGPWPAPQVYYKAAFAGGKTYRAKLVGMTDMSLYAFLATTTCSESAINAACTNPTPADPKKLYNSDLEETGYERLLFAPTAQESWVIAVDAYAASEAGPYSLTVEEYTTPTNGACATPKVVTLGSTSPTTVQGDTSIPGLKDEFTTGTGSSAKGVSCGNADAAPGWRSNQLYYKVALLAGKTYTIKAKGEWDPGLYAFPAGTACSLTAIDAACTKTNSDVLGNGKDETITIKPAANEEWVVVVDGWYSGAHPDGEGPFTLEIAWQ
ncbi:MAG: hypothetical protein IT371_13840 [Deltaproteobacteria bacterium]|nr:hypothetical protein [Deltaproteobacteria bacterium]